MTNHNLGQMEGLRPQWLQFISAYIKNGGNATEAYVSVYPEATRETARRNGSRLLTNADILEEIGYRYDEQRATDAWVIGVAMKYASLGIDNPKMAFASVKALELIARSKGMLTDIKKVEFSGENPAIFLPLITEAEKKKFDEMTKNGNRVFE